MENTHGVIIPFGKHVGSLLTRIPVSYLRWMINEKSMDSKWKDLAKAEFERRGDTFPQVEITGHALDNASLRVRKQWHQTALSSSEGLYSWLTRITLEAIDHGQDLGDGAVLYLGMKLVIEKGEEFPVLKTIMEKRVAGDEKNSP